MRVSGPGQPVHLLLDVVDLLNELHISYAVVGALAVAFHGVPRSTNDGDAIIWLKQTENSGRGLTERLEAAGYHAELRAGDPDDPIIGAIAIQDEHLNRMDLLLGIRGMDLAADERSVSGNLFGASVRFAGAEDLIAMKVFAGGPSDIDDVQGILHVSGQSVDRELLSRLARQYGIDVKSQLDGILKNLGDVR